MRANQGYWSMVVEVPPMIIADCTAIATAFTARIRREGGLLGSALFIDVQWCNFCMSRSRTCSVSSCLSLATANAVFSRTITFGIDNVFSIVLIDGRTQEVYEMFARVYSYTFT